MVGMLSAERSLELDESELFEEDQEQASPSVLEPASRLHSHAQAAQALSHGAPASTDGESESDDDGIVLESECSSSDAGDDVEELASRIQSLQSSLENCAAPLQEHVLGTSSHAGSQVGSLKSFGGTSFTGKRLFASEGDLAAASMPIGGGVTAPIYAGRRRVAPTPDKGCNLGTSMPISIPMMPRRGSSTDMASVAAAAAAGEKLAGRAATFVPPHMLHRHDSDLAGAGAGGLLGAEPSLGLSPSGGAKREKLLARNAILRSTGFIEVHHGVVPTAVIGEVLDPVKEQLLLGATATSALAVPAGMRPDSRSTPRSFPTRMLGTSK